MGAGEHYVLRPVRAGDYEYVIGRVDAWWDGRPMAPMLPRLFFVHFTSTTVIAADPVDDIPLGFLCGFRSATDRKIAYVHFVGVDPNVRGSGVGRGMYEWFFERVSQFGCEAVECVTSPFNTRSRAFHAAIGFSEERVEDYEGNGEPRMKLHRSLVPGDVPKPEPSDYVDANMEFWNSRVDAHANSPDYALHRFLDDSDHLSDVIAFDLPRLGEVAGVRGVHLQCHVGSDTVSLARLGADMTGLDLSGPALDVARRLAIDAGVDVDFVEADTYDALEVLERQSFDLVYTGIGALNWLPSIRRWAAVVAGLLKPGGRLFIREGHPVLWALAETQPDGTIVLEYPYFETEGIHFGGTGTYAETDQELGFGWTIEFNHGLGEIMSALIDEGMTIVAFEEHDSIPWTALDRQMEPIGGGEYRLIDRPERLPHSYTLQAIKN